MKKVVCLFMALLVIVLLTSCRQQNNSIDNTSSVDNTSSIDNISSFENTSSTKAYLSDSELAKIVATQLDIPENADVTYKVSEECFWEPADCYYKDFVFYENGFMVACASVDHTNGELLRNIYKYNVTNTNFYHYFKDEYFANSIARAMNKAPYEAVTEEELANFSGEISVVGYGESLAGIGYLKSITELSVAKCDVEEIPSEIAQCKNLKRLNLLKAFGLKKLPESIGELKELEYINVVLTPLENLPEGIGNLKSLKYLYAGASSLDAVPESIGNCESLIILDLHSTDITKIPDSVTKLKNLKSLDLGYTKITALPENIGALSQLVRLDLFGLDISRLPQSTKNLTKLEYLNVYDNYNLDEEYKQWFKNECYKCINDPQNNKDWDAGI